jgi:hypothetical protein
MIGNLRTAPYPELEEVFGGSAALEANPPTGRKNHTKATHAANTRQPRQSAGRFGYSASASSSFLR